MHQCLGETDALTIPLREIGDQSMPDLSQAASIDHAVHSTSAPAARDGPEGRAKAKELFHSVVGVERGMLRKISQPATYLHRLLPDVIAGHESGPFIRGEVRRQDAQRRRFSGPVRAEKPDDFPSLNLERDALQSSRIAESLHETPNIDHETSGSSRRPGCER